MSEVHPRTALLLVDMQKESGYGIEGMEAAVAAAATAVEACRAHGVPVVYTRHIGRADGHGLIRGDVLDDDGLPVHYRSDTERHEVLDALAPRPGELVVDKYRWSGFHETALDLMLRTAGIERLLVGGFTTDCCVLTTVHDAFARDYGIVLVEDACAATTSGAHRSAVLTLANWVYGIEVLHADQVEPLLAGGPHRSWVSTAPDQAAFASDGLDAVYERLSGSA